MYPIYMDNLFQKMKSGDDKDGAEDNSTDANKRRKQKREDEDGTQKWKKEGGRHGGRQLAGQ